jgi:hypothetical protein
MSKKLRRPEFRRRRKIRQRARKRRPIARVLKAIYSAPLWTSHVEESGAVLTEELLRSAERYLLADGRFRGRYFESKFYFEVTLPERR